MRLLCTRRCCERRSSRVRYHRGRCSLRGDTGKGTYKHIDEGMDIYKGKGEGNSANEVPCKGKGEGKGKGTGTCKGQGECMG